MLHYSQHTEPTAWYKPENQERWRSLFAYYEHVDKDQSERQTQYKDHAHLYSNRYEPGFDFIDGQVRSGYLAITDNIIRSVVDTATSIIGKSRPKASITTDGADWKTYRVANQLNKYLLGSFKAYDLFAKMADVFRDACVWGTGCLKIVRTSRQLLVERVLISDILVDETSLPRAGGLPRQLAQMRYVHKEVLRSKFGGKKGKKGREIEDAIDKAGLSWRKDSGRMSDELVLVIEAWHLPSGPNAGDGRHTLSVDGVDLVDESYDHDFYPFVFYHWKTPLTGFYGQGLAEELLDDQIRVNELNDFIRRSQDLGSSLKIFVEQGSNVLEDEYTNDIAQFVYYQGQKPTPFVGQTVHPEIYQYYDSLIERAFARIGINRLSAQAVTQPGFEAGVAIRELSDSQSQRLSIEQQRWEDAYLWAAQLILVQSRLLYKGRSAKDVEFPDKDLIESINWDLVNFENNNLTIRIQASSLLGDTPAGRLARFTELAQYNVLLSPATILRLLDHPDIEAETRVQRAELDDIRWSIGECLEGREQIPEPGFQNLDLGIAEFTAAYLDTRRIKDVPLEVTEYLQNWVILARDEQQKAAAAAAPPPQPGVPPGAEDPLGGVGGPGLPPGAEGLPPDGGIPPELAQALG